MEILSLFKLRIGSRGKKESRGMLWDGSLNTSAPPGCLILKQPRKNIKGWGLGHEEHADHMSITALSLLRKQSAPDPLGRSWNDKQNNKKTTQHVWMSQVALQCCIRIPVLFTQYERREVF